MEFGMDMCCGTTPAGQVAMCLECTKTAMELELPGRPINFARVIPGVYRSSYPEAKDYEYLKTLGLKTIVTLVQKDFPEGFQAFMQKEGIQHVVIDMQGTKKVEISLPVVTSVMEIVLDHRNYPILMHCNHGKHRTGCCVAIIRKLMGFSLSDIIQEYTLYAGDKVREQDIRYITEFDVSSLVNLQPMSAQKANRAFKFMPLTRPQEKKATFTIFTAVVLLIWYITFVLLAK